MTDELSSSDRPALSIVIGVQHGQKNLPAILDVLRPDMTRGIEVLLCHASDDPLKMRMDDFPNLRCLEGKEDALIPELWRDGIVAARSHRVAILTAHCVPAETWLEAVLSCDLNRHVAWGGVIRNHVKSNAVGMAIHLLRYSGVSDVRDTHMVAEIAADNAVYCRDEIMACTDLLNLGFWEPSYHARFRARGLTLALTPDLIVTHDNQYTAKEFARQRRRHGRAFGLARAADAGMVRRILLLLASPLAFLVHAVKLTLHILKTPALRSSFFRSAPWFYLFMANWNWGEAQGYAAALFGRSGLSAHETGEVGR